jgi:site-specific recombinase XerD
VARSVSSISNPTHDLGWYDRPSVTIARYLPPPWGPVATLKSLYKTALKWGYVSHNPAAQVTMMPEDQKVPDALTESQIERLLEVLPDYGKAVVIAAVETGMRSSELFQLQWLRDLMGHKSLRTTQRYAQVNPDATRKAFRAFDRSSRL